MTADIFDSLRNEIGKSSCLKAKVACCIMHGDRIITVQTNECSPPEGVCRRRNVKGNYDLCNSVHAEFKCAKSMKAEDVTGGIAYLAGRSYACDNCKDELRKVGVSEIRIVDLNGVQ